MAAVIKDRKLQRRFTCEQMEEAFSVFDENDDNKIDEREFKVFFTRLVTGKWRDAFLGLSVELQLTPGCEPLQHVWYVSVLMLGADGKVYDLVTRCAIEPPARPCGAHACAWCVGCELVIAHGGAQPGLWCADPSTCTQPERRGERELRFLLPTHEQVTLGFYSQVARDDFESRFFGGGS